MITLKICAPLSSVHWGYRRYGSFIDWLIDWKLMIVICFICLCVITFFESWRHHSACCTSVTDGGPTLKPHWCKVSWLFYHWNDQPCTGMLTGHRLPQHWSGIGWVYRLYVVHCRDTQHTVSTIHCPVLNGSWPAPAMVAKYWIGIGLESCWLIVHCCRQN